MNVGGGMGSGDIRGADERRRRGPPAGGDPL